MVPVDLKVPHTWIARRFQMGMFRDGAVGHEGFGVSFITQDGVPLGSGHFRELAYPMDDKEHAVEMLAAGCECGWRSPRWPPMAATRWAPFIVHTTGNDEEKVRQLWDEHAASMIHDAGLRQRAVQGCGPAGRGAGGTREDSG